MPAVTLIGFSEDAADRLTIDLAADGYEVSRASDPTALSPHATAIFVCGDRERWKRDLCEIRAICPRMISVVVTRLPEHTIWLDALEAGANDYACMPLDRRQLEWLFPRRLPQRESSGRTCSTLAS